MADSPIILYDGVCALCNAFTAFVLRHDVSDVFKFAALQSAFARAALLRHGVTASDLETVYIVRAPGTDRETVIGRARAVAFILGQLPRTAWLGRLLAWVPSPLANAGYALVATRRYRLFGKFDTCPLPSVAHRAKFLDVSRDPEQGPAATSTL